jgi:hypothetical protein
MMKEETDRFVHENETWNEQAAHMSSLITVKLIQKNDLR